MNPKLGARVVDIRDAERAGTLCWWNGVTAGIKFGPGPERARPVQVRFVRYAGRANRPASKLRALRQPPKPKRQAERTFTIEEIHHMAAMVGLSFEEALDALKE